MRDKKESGWVAGRITNEIERRARKTKRSGTQGETLVKKRRKASE